VEIDGSALASNLRALARRVGPDVLMAPVVKSNAYGHGIELAARAFRSGGAHWMCVHRLDEALAVHALDLGVSLLVLGPVAAGELADAVDLGIHFMVSEFEQLEAAAQAARTRERAALLHLKIETGTHRQGISLEQLPEFLKKIRRDDALELVGMHSHFANIEDTTQHEFARGQIQRFEQALEIAAAADCSPRIRHMASSAATILFESTHYDLVRPGIASYGYWPSRETLVSARGGSLAELELHPALSWKTRITQLQDVPAGDYVGYGCTERLTSPTRLAVIPVGYADGYRRSLSSLAHVLVRGHRCPVRGRICMNLTMVDVTHAEGAALGDEVVLLGRQEDEVVTAEQMAGWAGTIHYEILASIAAHLPRIPAGGAGV
jgi:alanine racemase